MSEVAAIQWEDVNVTDTAVWIRMDGKTGVRNVPIPLETWNRVRAIIGDGIYGTLHGGRAKVDSLIRSHVEIGVAAKFMGHSPLVMLRAYRQVTEEELLTAMSTSEPVDAPSRKRKGTK